MNFCGAHDGSLPDRTPSGFVTLPPLDDAAGIERTIREYFESLDDVRPLAGGPIAAFLDAIARPAEWPAGAEQAVGRELEIERLSLERIDGDVAEVRFEATHRVERVAGPKGRTTMRWMLRGPVVLTRRSGAPAWRIADYVLNGRPRSASLHLRLTGQQEINGLTLSAVAVDLRDDSTAVWIQVANDRQSTVRLAWSALGIPRGGGWKFVRLEMGDEIHPGPGTGAFIALDALPLDTRELRLIVVEHGERVGFDFVIDLHPQVDYEPVQRPPDALPLRLRLQRSPFGIAIPMVLLVASGLLLGSWRAAGVLLLGLGGFLLLQLVYGTLRRRRPPAWDWRPAVAMILALGIGAALVALGGEGSSPSGCGSRAKARGPADRFALALLAGHPDAAAREIGDNEQLVAALPQINPVSLRRARTIVREGQLAKRGDCAVGFLPTIPGAPDPPDFCFYYDLPENVREGFSAGPLIVFAGCYSGRWQVDGFD